MTGLNPIAGARELLIAEIMAIHGQSSPNPRSYRQRIDSWTLVELASHRSDLLDSIDEQIGEKINSQK